MSKQALSYQWSKQQQSKDLTVVDCSSYDPIKDFRRDPSGFYVLIRPNVETLQIEVAICDKKHVIVAVFRGGKAQDLYEGIFQYEKKHQITWFKSKGHAAYLGKELKKAQLALCSGKNDYYQE